MSDKWQGMDRAPKMRMVLLYAATDIGEDGRVLNYKMACGFWHSGYATEDRDQFSPWNWEGRQLHTWDIQPTHWMPLPEPPASPSSPESETMKTETNPEDRKNG